MLPPESLVAMAIVAINDIEIHEKVGLDEGKIIAELAGRLGL